MSLRRSARLSAIPSIKPPLPSSPVKVTRVQNSSVTKPRKAITKKTAPKPTKAPEKPTTSYWSPEPPTTDDSTQKLAENSVTTDTPNNRPHTPPPLDRPVDPHRTNVTLLTPHGSSVSAYPPRTEDASPSKTGLPRPAATTGTLLEKGLAHLIATDPRLRTVIELHPCPLFSPEGLAEKVDPFNSLTSSIIGQQVSGAAAKSIRNKFLALFDLENSIAENGRSKFPLPEEVARCDIVTLRTAGLSQRKAEYIQGLAEKFANGELSAQMLARASDEELVEKLIAVRGLGKWSVEMFACFALKRIDVFSTGDLGVQRGCAAFMGRDVSKMKGKGGGKFKYMAEKDMLELAAKFAPYRSLFMWYMWRIENVDVAVLTG
ncbi:DNA glycosylase [Penicillium malachiteum]|uniref:DNA glycosylase n=1 Tax=Penicillium malachiteum TaxID=1324776 RepID=UPI002546A723|nr:DNA glycosylase [Penicillium malachiteum]KAJ5714889.1 DNA glycosylase [Penicillium malachiteum]